VAIKTKSDRGLVACSSRLFVRFSVDVSLDFGRGEDKLISGHRLSQNAE
jgi:hypothetical protein